MGTKGGAALLTLGLCGCLPINSERGVYGRYELRSPGATTYVDLRADHTWTETIRYASGAVQEKSGKWHWTESQTGLPLCFEALFLPKQASFFRLIQGDLPGWVKDRGTAYELDQCASPLVEYGKTTLEIDPDSDENFVRVAR